MEMYAYETKWMIKAGFYAGGRYHEGAISQIRAFIYFYQNTLAGMMNLLPVVPLVWMKGMLR